MNAFQPDSMTFERKDSLVQHLIAESVEKFAFKAEKKEHPEEKELDKFMYVFYGGNFVDHLKRQEQKVNVYNLDVQKGNKRLKLLQNETEVKFESEGLCKNMEALKREKLKLKAPFDKLENLEVALRVKADTDKALEPKHRAVSNAKTALSSLLDGLRVLMKRAEACKGDEEPKILLELESHLTTPMPGGRRLWALPCLCPVGCCWESKVIGQPSSLSFASLAGATKLAAAIDVI